MGNVIEIEGLSKSFGDVKAVRSLSFSVREGELFAFLGVNGAGKSTTISIICGKLEKDGGQVVVCGRDTDLGYDGIKGNLGVVFQNSLLDGALSVGEMEKEGLPSEVASDIMSSLDCNVTFFDHVVSEEGAYIIICTSTLLLLGVYVLLNITASCKKSPRIRGFKR